MGISLRKLIVAASIASYSYASHAGGLYLYEIGTSDLGFASAGTAARAEDASTIYANPAGMTRLEGDQFTAGAQLLYGKAEYELDGNGLLNGGDPGNIVGWLPGGSAFYSHSISDDLKVGIGAYGNFGLALDFGDSWAGKNLVDKTALMAMTIQPTIAYRINDHWSLGAGMTANYGFFKLERDRLSGGDTNQIDHDWAYGARLGLMYEPTNKTRIGLVWNSEVEYEFNVDSTLTIGPIGPIGPITTTIPMAAGVKAPQQVMTSIYHRLNDDWAVMGNLGWQDWSEFADTTIEVNGVTSSSNLALEDTWHVAAGAQYTLDAQTKLNAGVAFDTSMYKHQSQTSFALPNGDTWRLGLGMQYALSSQSDLGVAAEYARSEDSSTQSALISGGYDNPEMLFMSVHYTRRF
jgi:long-chain fatty acid transport protein